MAEALTAVALLAALPVGYVAACVLWHGSTLQRLAAALALLVLSAIPHMMAPVLLALPMLAALRRLPAGIADEAKVAGCSTHRFYLVLLPRPAAPGLLYGAGLCIAALRLPIAPVLIAASLPLLMAIPPGARRRLARTAP